MRLNYELSGDRGSPVVLFLHGFMGSSADWRDVMARIGDRSLCIALDLPGHGASLGLKPGSYAIEGSALAVIHTLDELEVRRPAIVGYSMGGRLALYLALRYPERCAGIFLESASPGLEGEGEREARRAEDEEKARRLGSGGFDEFLRDWYRQPLFASLARNEELLGRTIAGRRSNDPGELARSLRGMGVGSQPSLWEELERLRVPALAVAGELDQKFVRIARRMAGVSPKMRSGLVPDAGHNVHAEKPDAYLVLLETFLEDATLPELRR